MNCKPRECEQRQAQERGALDLELPQHEHQQAELRQNDEQLKCAYSAHLSRAVRARGRRSSAQDCEFHAVLSL